MAFKDWLKEYRESENKTNKQSSSAASNVSNTSTYTSANTGSVSFRDSLKEYREQQAGSSVQSWTQASNALLSEVQEYYNSGWKGKDDDRYTSFQDRATNLLAQADGYRKQYAGNKQAISSINSVVSALSDLKGYAYSYSNYYSKFEDEEEYNTALRHYGYQKKYEGSSYDAVQSALATMQDGEEKSWLQNNQYSLYKGASDFGAKSASGLKRYESDQAAAAEAAKQANEDKRWWEKLGEYLYEGGVSDTTMPLGNTSQIIQSLRNDTSWSIPTNKWNDEQRNVYGYLYEQDQEAAANYARFTSDSINQAELNKKISKIEEFSTRSGLHMAASTIAAIATMPLSLADTMAAMTEYQARGFVSTPDTVMAGRFNNAVTGAISEALNQKYGTLSEDIPVIGGKGVGDAYQLGTSIANSMLTAYTMGTVGTYMVFFGSASASTMYEAMDRGATDSQAITLGILSGLAEAAGEAFSVDKLLKISNSTTLKAFFWNVLKQAGVEASEEGVTTVLNNFADQIVMGDKSNFNIAVTYYMQQGLSEQEAKRKAWKDMANDLAYDMLGGAISGGVSSGIQGGVQTVYANKEAKQKYGPIQDELIQEALEIDPTNKFAQDMQAKAARGKNLGGGQLNELVQQNEATMLAQDTKNIRWAATKRLLELGETGSVTAIAEALTKQASGEQLSGKEKKLIAGSKYGQRVSNELNPDNIRSGETSSEWAQRIGTNRINADEYSRLVEVAEMAQEPSSAPVAKGVTQQQEAAETVEQPVSVAQEAVTEPVQTAEVKQEAPVTEEATEETGEETVTLEAASKKYGAQAGAMIHTYQQGQDVERYDAAYQSAYNMGKSGVNLSYAKNSASTSYLTENQRELAHQAGVDAAKSDAETKQAAVAKSANGKKGRRRGTVRGEGVKIADMKKAFNDPQGKAYKVLTAIADVTGVDIVLYQSQANENGVFEGSQGKFKWKDDTIHIDINAGLYYAKDVNELQKYTMLRTFSHEFTHFIEKWNPVRYNEFRRVVFDTLTERGENVHDLIEEKMARSGLDYDAASREVVAEAMTDILPDATFVEKLANEHKTIFEKLLEKLKEFAQTLREYFDSLGTNPSKEANALKEQVGDGVRYVESIVQLFDNVAMEAVSAYQMTVAGDEVIAEPVAAVETETVEVATPVVESKEVPFDKKTLTWLKNANRVSIMNINGQTFITDGALVLPANENQRQYAIDNYHATVTANSLPVQNIINSADKPVTKVPFEGTICGISALEFLIDNKRAYFNKKLFSFIDGGLLYYAKYGDGYLLKSVGEDGSIKGCVLSLRPSKNATMTDVKPSKLKSFNKKMMDLIHNQTTEQAKKQATSEDTSEEVKQEPKKPAEKPKKIKPVKTKKEDWEHHDVMWSLPAGSPNEAHTVAYSSDATMRIIDRLADNYPELTISEAVHKLNTEERQRVLQQYIDSGYGEQRIGEWWGSENAQKKPITRWVTPVFEPPVTNTETPKPAASSDDAYEKLEKRLRTVDSVTVDGFRFSVDYAAGSHFGRIDRDDPNKYVRNARSVVYVGGAQKKRNDAIQDIVDVARNNKLLGELAENTTHVTETKPAVDVSPTAVDETPAAIDHTPSEMLAHMVLSEYLNEDNIKNGRKVMTSKLLYQMADKAFGGTQAEGAYNRKDAYDALELAVNKFLLGYADRFNGDANTAVDAVKFMQELLELLPTQNVRTQEMEDFQQFSTPPNIAYLAAWAANISSGDFALEPSAGIGGLAVFAKAWGAEVAVNELSKRRLEVLRAMGFDHLFNENAEQIDNILPDSIAPSVVIMNPPFSSTAGRTKNNKTSNAEKHIDQALARLQDGGRLVAILGQGMNDADYYRYWDKLRQEYSIRANLSIDGDNYKKYGTTYGVQLVVIDKTGPQTGETITGKFSDLTQVPAVLEGIRNDRQNMEEHRHGSRDNGQRESVADGRNEQSETGHSGSAERAAGDSSDTQREKSGSVSERTEGTADRTDGKKSAKSGRKAAERKDGRGTREAERTDSGTGNRTDESSDTGRPQSEQSLPELNPPAQEVSDDGVYATFVVPELPVKGSGCHPAVLVESAAMAAVSMPKATYQPKLPAEVVRKNLSDAQMVTVTYAGQAHAQKLPDGRRKGFFIGDGTGVGKGRQIAGIILDNFMQGRTKAVWISKNNDLFEDAIRDWTGTTGRSGDEVISHSKIKPKDKISLQEGVLYSTYDTLKSEKGGNRLDQIVEWLGEDFDGVIAFDEAHNMGNLFGKKGKFGKAKGSEKAKAGVELQRRLPNARIVYVSATAATEVDNLAYAERIGLWGKGTAFNDAQDFIAKIGSAGLAAMELVIRDMKAMGVYVARSISYNGVNYDTVEHQLTPMQTEIYDTMSRAWQKVMSNVHIALETTGGKYNSTARQRAMGNFYSSMQRFYNQVLTSMSMPSVIADMRKELDAGHSCVLQVVNTNEAQQNKQLAAAKASGTSLDDLDLTPREALIGYLNTSFPTQLFEEYTDDEGNLRSRPVLDSNGQPVHDKKALRQRDALIEEINQMSIPDGPLEMLFDAFGPDAVAENTGRSRRVVPRKQPDGSISRVEERRTLNHRTADVQAFQDGKKRILVFSDAGGTGKSYHADLSEKNQQLRIHYVLQPGWVASNAVQGFGRTHRSNEASAPVYKLVTTNIKGQKRFTSTIARRLDQLGALTKGQRDTGSGMFGAKDNLETDLAKDSLREFYIRLGKNQIEGINGMKTLERLGLKQKFTDEFGGFKVNDALARDIGTFLNRILALEVDEQNVIFDAFISIYEMELEAAIQAGTLDTGMENVKADKIEIVDDKVIREADSTGAATHYIQAKTYIRPRIITTVDEISQRRAGFVGVYRLENDSVRAVFRIADKTTEWGAVRKQYRLVGPNVGATTNVWNEDTLKAKATEVDRANWQTEWDAEVARVPEYNENTLHMLTGALLPIWNSLPQEGNTKVKRLIASDGSTYLGRVIDNEQIDSVLGRFSVDRTKEVFTAQQVMDKAIKDGTKFYLNYNRTQIFRSRVSGEWRLEITQQNSWYLQRNYPGIVHEKIQYRDRYFIPVGEKGIEILEKLLKDNPVRNTAEEELVQYQGREYLAADREPAPVFYSHMARVIDGVKQEKLGAASVVSMLRGKGVKQEEIKWSGIEEFLAGKKSVTKAELQEFVAGSMLEIEEVMLTYYKQYTKEQSKQLEEISKSKDYAWGEMWDLWETLFNDELPIEILISRVPVRSIDRELAAAGLSETEDGRRLHVLAERVEEMNAIEDRFALAAPGGDAKWDKYKLDGGEDYREYVFKLPESNFTNTAMRAHWGTDNKGVLVHARVQDFNSVYGRVLMVEEIQSDWHNEGRESGYADKKTEAEIERLKAVADEKFFAMEDYSTEITGSAGEWEAMERTVTGSRLLLEYIEARDAYDNAMNEYVKKVPDAPFRDTYHEYVMKRMIREAAEKGYDMIAWTTAETQIKRWSKEFEKAYRIEYDQEIPKFMRKYGKKWGASVGKINVGAYDELWDIDSDTDMDSDDWLLSEGIKDEGTEVWAMNITEAMRDSVVYEGQAQYQQRTNTLSDREVLTIAANEIPVDTLTDGEKDALNIFKKRLDKLDELQMKRAEAGQLYKEQQFGKGTVDRKAAEETRERMQILDKQIAEAEKAVLTVEDKAVLKRVLQKARKVVEAQQRAKDKVVLDRWRQRRNETAAIKKYRDRIRKDVDDMSKWILHPNNKNVLQHVPDALKSSVVPFLTSIDFTSKRQLKGGEATQADKEFMKQLNAVKAAVKTNIEVEGLYSGYNDLPPNFMERLQIFIDSAQALVEHGGGELIINRMTAAELKELSEVVRTLKKYIMDFNKFHVNAMYKHVYDAGNDTISELAQMDDASEHTGKVSNFLFWQQIRPAYAFERFGNGGKAIYDGLRRGQATLAFNTKAITDFAELTYSAAEVQAWEKEIKTIKLSDGSVVKMPVSMAMSFYELFKRPQAKQHILGQGIRVATYMDGRNKIADKGHLITPADVEKIIGTLTPRQIEVADKLQKFMAEQGGKWGNHVSVARFGEELFGEKEYFPINSDGRHLQATADEHPSAASLYALLNMGFTKELNEEANNRIILYSIFDVFSNHMASMAQYNAFALPVLDALKWFNYQQRDMETKEVLGSVRDQMARVYGTPEETRPGSGRRGYAESFVINIIKAFNGTEAQGSPNDGLPLQMLHRYNMAQVAFNARVVIQQPLAITRAALLVSPQSIARALTLSPAAVRKNIDEMRQYSGIAAWKALGFYDVNISRGVTALIKHDEDFMDKVADVGMKGAELADTVTWAAMWAACKEEVIHKRKLKPKDAGFMEAVTQLFEDVVYKTQVVDSVLTKNEYMRDKGFGARMISSFMSEPTTTASMLIDAYDKFAADMQRGMSRQQAWQKNKDMVARTFAVYAVGQVLLAAVQAVADAWRDDDDYQTFMEKVLEAFKGNVFDELNPLGKLPIVSDFMEVVKELASAFGFDTYGNVQMTAIGQITEYFSGAFEILHDKISGEKTNYTWYAAVYKLLQAVSGATGLPMASFTREVAAMWNNTVGAMAPSLKLKTYRPSEFSNIKYAYEDGWLTDEEAASELLDKGHVDNEDEAYWTIQGWEAGGGFSKYDALDAAVRNMGSVQEAMQELTTHGVTQKEAIIHIKSSVSKWYRDGEISNQQALSMLKTYCGLGHDDALVLVNKWSSEVQTGISYDDIKEQYMAGKISEAQAIDMRVRYGGYSQEDATWDVKVWTWQNEGFETDSRYVIQDYEEFCEPAGIDKKTYFDAYLFYKDSGQTDVAYSKTIETMPYINSLPLSAAQKTALALCWWAESTVNKYKLW